MKKLFLNVAFLMTMLVLFNFNTYFAKETGKSLENPNENQTKFALLVGVNKQKKEGIKALEACKNNVELLSTTLSGNYGFNIKSLIGEDAEYQAIKDNFQSHLIENAKKVKAKGGEAVIVYYFCGHGSQYPDLDGDETDDRMDETFLAYDSRTDGIYDILDDEIYDLKAELKQHTTNATYIFESCHSGTGSRGDDKIIAEEVKPQTEERTKKYVRKYEPTEDADLLSYTEISASQPDTQAYAVSAENCKDDCKPYSFMTKALNTMLRRVENTEISYRSLMNEVSTEVRKIALENGVYQIPQVEGNRDAYLFKGAANRARPHIEIESISENADEITIRAGLIHGLTAGDKVSVFSFDEKFLSTGRLKRVGNNLSVVELPKDNPDTKEISLTSQVLPSIPVQIVLEVEKLNIKPLRDDADPSIAEAAVYNQAKAHNRFVASFENEMQTAFKNLGFVETEITGKTLSGKNKKEKNDPANKTAQPVFVIKKGKVADVFPQKSKMVPYANRFYCDENKLKEHSEELLYPQNNEDILYIADNKSQKPLLGMIFNPADANVFKDLANVIRSLVFQAKLSSLQNDRSAINDYVEIKLEQFPDGVIGQECKENKVKNVLTAKDFKFQKITEKQPIDSSVMISIKNISTAIRQKKDPKAPGESFYLTVLSLTNRGEIILRTQPIAEKNFSDVGTDIKIPLKLTAPEGLESLLVIVSRDYIDFSFYKTEIKYGDKAETKSRGDEGNLSNMPQNWFVKRFDFEIVAQ